MVHNLNGSFSPSSQVACIIILICFGASNVRGYMGLSISMLVYTVVIFVIFMCSLHTQMTFIHWGWTVRDFIYAEYRGGASNSCSPTQRGACVYSEAVAGHALWLK